MQPVIESLIKDLHASMLKKLTLLWPQPGGYFPPEANIIYEIAKLGSKYNYEVFGECNIGKNRRADMIILNSTDKWICHVECKLVNIQTCRNNTVIDDLERVSKRTGIDYLLNNVNYANTSNTLNQYKKCGLFVGADVSWVYSWWTAAAGNHQSIAKFCSHYSPQAEQQNRINQLQSYYQQSARWGTVPPNPQDGTYWIVYSFFDL